MHVHSSNLCDEGFLSPHRIPMYLPLLTQEEARLGVAAELLGVDGYRSVVLVACRRTGYGVEKVTRLQAPYPGVFVLPNCHK